MQVEFSHSQIAMPQPKAYAFSMSLKLNIREIREAQGRTIAEVAGKIGTSVPHLSGIERGVKNLNNHILERLSSALGVPPEALISSEDISPLVHLLSIVGRLDDRDLARVTDLARALRDASEAAPHNQ